MVSLKHVGRVKNTGRRCVVVFREMYDDQGHVIDENNCLVVETDTLPDAEHQDIIKIVESEPAQATGDLFNVMARERLSTGANALKWMADAKRLRKYPTSNVELLPDSRTTIGLDTLNTIVKMQKAGASEADIAKVLNADTELNAAQSEELSQNVTTESTSNNAPAEDNSQTGESTDGVMDDAAIAKMKLEQSVMFSKQAEELKAEAFALDPSLKPRRGRKPKPKEG